MGSAGKEEGGMFGSCSKDCCPYFFFFFYEVCILVESESALGYARDIKGYVVSIGYTVQSPAI